MPPTEDSQAVSAGRWVTVDGQTNFRDIGGYPTADGRRVRYGLIYRSDEGRGGSLAYAAAALGLATILDLRASDERLGDGNGHDGQATRSQRLHVPLFEAIAPSWSSPTDLMADAIADRYLEMLNAGAHQFAAILGHLASPDCLPAVVHCVAGRDRTGIVVTCLLSILGVSDDIVADDYALSPPMRLNPEQVTSVGAEVFAVDRRVALGFLARIRAIHGSAELLARKQGVTDEQLALLYERLVT